MASETASSSWRRRRRSRSEEAAAEEIEERLEDDLFADAENAWVSGGVGGGDAAAVDELAAVPVGALLMAAFHAAAAESAVDAAAERVETSVAVARPLDVGLRGFECRLPVVAQRALLDAVEELAVDDRFVRRSGAPDPLFARPDDRAAGTFVVAAPDVEAGVFRVAEHGLDLRAAPGLAKVVLVLLVAGRRRVAVEVGVELVADRAEPEPVEAVVLEDHPYDRRRDRVEDEPVLLAAIARLLRVGMLVRFELVAVGGGAAGMPALADALFHAAAALLDQVADVPLGDALLDAAGEDRGRVRGHRLVRGEEGDVALLEVALDPGRVGGHAREPVDALDDDRVEGAAVGSGGEEVGQAAGTGERDGEACAVGAGTALVELLAAALDVPVVGDDLAARLLDDALASGELSRQREGWVLCVFGGDASVEGELHAVLLRWMRRQAARRISTACRKRRTIAASCLERSSSALRPCAVATTISTVGPRLAVSRTRSKRSAAS